MQNTLNFLLSITDGAHKTQTKEGNLGPSIYLIVSLENLFTPAEKCEEIQDLILHEILFKRNSIAHLSKHSLH